MTRNVDVISINCTACGAGLDVLGGGRVQTHVCSYCGSYLDAQDAYKVLQKFDSVDRPDSPFSIGMTGQVFGVDYTVIGTLRFEERHRGMTWRWVDHQLYSPTHGYAFMTVEKGHFIFSRAYRKATTPDWLDAAELETRETPPSVMAADGRFRYYDTSNAKITFAEGEFNWQPKLDDRSTTVSVMSSDAVIGFSKTATEMEVIRSIYPNQLEIAESFGLEWAPAVRGVHRLQPYLANVHAGFVSKTALIAMLVSLVLFLGALTLGRGTLAAEETLLAEALPTEVSFDITQPDQVATLRVEGNFNNSWASLGMTVTDPTGQLVSDTGRTISYYSGRDADGRWSEGSKNTVMRFVPSVAGTYTLEVALEAQEGGRAFSQLGVKVYQGAFVAKWFLFAAILFGVLWAIPAFSYARHQRARWRGMDWSED